MSTAYHYINQNKLMKIAIIVAMDKELALILPRLTEARTLEVNGFTFHSGKMGSREVVVGKCGIGKVNTAVNALTLIEHFKPSVVINTGVAGGTGAARVGDVVVADRIAYHDVWCGPDTIHGQAAGCPRLFISTFSDNIFEGLHIRRGLVASGDIFVSKPSEVRHILDLYPDAVAVDMESAAIAHVCHLKHVAFLCVRVVSDTPGGEDNILQYENFWQDAPQHTFEVIDTVVARL